MSKIYTIEEIREKVKPIAEKYGIDKVWLFGSYARGEATEDSDVDFVLTYTKLIGKFALGGVFADMEDTFGMPVDIVSERALRNEYSSELDKTFLENIERDRKLLYERQY
jgi:predicted nucleotidyltransferase